MRLTAWSATTDHKWCRCGADSGSEEAGGGDGTELPPWECAPGLLSLACLDVDNLSAGHSTALARHAATLTALTALTWIANSPGRARSPPRPSGHGSAGAPAAADSAADIHRAPRAGDAVHAMHAVTDPSGVGTLAAALWDLPRLRALTLEATDATSAAAAVLAAALRSSALLTRLSLCLRSFREFTARGGSVGGMLMHGMAGVVDAAGGPLCALTNLQHVSLQVNGGVPLSTRRGASSGAGGWEAIPRSVNELVVDLAAAPQLTFLCLRETGCTRDAAEGAAAPPSTVSKAARQGCLRGGGGEGGGPACRLSPHYSRLAALRSLTLEFDFCFVAALAPQLERLRRLQRLEVRAGASDGRREVLRRLARSTARLPLHHGVRFRADLADA